MLACTLAYRTHRPAASFIPVHVTPHCITSLIRPGRSCRFRRLNDVSRKTGTVKYYYVIWSVYRWTAIMCDAKVGRPIDVYWIFVNIGMLICLPIWLDSNAWDHRRQFGGIRFCNCHAPVLNVMSSTRKAVTSSTSDVINVTLLRLSLARCHVTYIVVVVVLHLLTTFSGQVLSNVPSQYCVQLFITCT